MINQDNFNETFKYVAKDVIIQIIDLFIEEHGEDMKQIKQCMDNKDFTNLNFHAHHLKGSIANFMDAVSTELTQKLEEMGEANTKEELQKTYAELEVAIKSLVVELNAYRKKITS